MPSFHKLVILFTRFPQVGRCKRRMIPSLGAKGALNIHRQLVSHILNRLTIFLSSHADIDFTIFYYGGSQQQMREWLGSSHTCQEQQGDNLGERMADALLQSLKNGQDTILIGSDCPDIDAATLKESFQALTNNDIVVGPAHDGGYYLIGVAGNLDPAACRKLFEKIPWGTDTVYSRTVAHTENLGLRTHILSKLHDIDTEEDLTYFHHCSHPE
jgi:uncharacterized protein